MKKIVPVISVLALLLVATPIFAESNSKYEQKPMVSASPSGNQVVNQNQVKTQNEGEDSELMVKTAEQENLGEDVMETSKNPMSAVNMSEVSQKIEEFLNGNSMLTGVGQQVKAIVLEQKTVQEEIKAELDKVDNRSKLAKALVGPDYKALKTMQMQMEQNQMRIEEMAKLMTQLTNKGDITQVSEMIQALTDQNVALQDKINLEVKTGSLFGWLVRLFVK